MKSSLQDPQVQKTLTKLHKAARWNMYTAYKVPFYIIYATIVGKDLFEVMPTSALKHSFLPVFEEEGMQLYHTARSCNAKLIVEFGCSFGISTIYLAAAARDNGGRVITTEMEPTKCEITRKHLQQAGLSEYVEIRQGDALVTLRDLAEKVDLLFLDGWKNLYKPLLDLMLPKLSPGAAVIADNVGFSSTEPFNKAIAAPDSDFVITSSSKRGTVAYYKPSSDFLSSKGLFRVEPAKSSSLLKASSRVCLGLAVAGAAYVAHRAYTTFSSGE